MSVKSKRLLQKRARYVMQECLKEKFAEFARFAISAKLQLPHLPQLPHWGKWGKTYFSSYQLRTFSVSSPYHHYTNSVSSPRMGVKWGTLYIMTVCTHTRYECLGDGTTIDNLPYFQCIMYINFLYYNIILLEHPSL